MKALLKYALRNLWRMKFRSLALFAVLFLLSAAAVVGLISARSTASEAERIRLKTPVTVTVQPRAAEAKTNEEGGAMQEANPNVTIADVQTLLRSPYVKDCGVHIPALYGAEIGGVVDAQADVAALYEQAGASQAPEILSPNLLGAPLTVIASSSVPLYDAFADATFRLSAGRFPRRATPETGYADDILIPSAYAGAHGLSVGDTVTLHRENYFCSMTVCGLYDSDGEEARLAFTSLDANMWYLFPQITDRSGTSDANYPIRYEHYDDNFTFERADLLLYRGDTAAAFIQETADSGFDLGKFKLTANDKVYKQLTARLDDLTTVTAVFTAVILTAGLLIFFLLIVNFTANRAKEIGILRALGSRPAKVLAALAAELGVIVLCALVVGFLIGSAGGRGFVSYLNRSVAAETEPEAGQQAFTLLGEQDAADSAAIEIHLNGGGDSAILLCVLGGGLAVTGVALLLCWTRIMRTEPMEILSGGEDGV